MKMENPKLGRTPRLNDGRDAVHVAIMAVIADITLLPGQHVGLTSKHRATTETTKMVGIVDPFLTKPVHAGQLFYLLLYPDAITSLRHVWTHPDILEPRLQSEAWLRSFCANADCPGFETVMSALLGKLPHSQMTEEYFYFEGSDAHGEIPREFWHHAENYLGVKFDAYPKSFACSC